MNTIPDDLARWRKEQRRVLLARRESVDRETLERWRRAMDAHLERGFPGLAQCMLGICWPHRKEYDPRHLAARLRQRGAGTALPVVRQARAPLIFREWHPGVKLAHGALGIPFPVDSEEVVPDAVLVPLVGFDSGGYRLGYGGGYFDRTLAAMARRPLAIGVGFELSRLDSIVPQSHDVPMDWIVTERGIYRRDSDGLAFLDAPRIGEASLLASPVCYAAEFERSGLAGDPDQRRNSR
jgi:5-formyltetrahydrofolate cyclo-ligase